MVPFGDVLQRAAFLCVQLYGQAIAAAAVRRAQQARRRWHLRQTLTPPTLAAFAPLAQRLVGVTLCEVIEVGRRRVMGGYRWALVIKRRQIFHQQAKAHGIAGDHIEIDMQAAAPLPATGSG